jgi:dihydroneopterin aldolase
VESVAEGVAARLLRDTPARTVRVRIAKPHPPIAGADIDEECVEIERSR